MMNSTGTEEQSAVDERNRQIALFNQIKLAKTEWEATMDSAEDIFILTDGNGCVKRCNKALKNFTGRSFHDILGKKWNELLDVKGFDFSITESKSHEFYHESSQKWFLMKTTPYNIDQEEHYEGSVISLHDTTARKKAEQELVVKNSELEKAYADLKATQARILLSDKMASIGQLAAGVAHEINNPIGFISSNLSTLQKYMSKITSYCNTIDEKIKTVCTADDSEDIQNLKKKEKIDFIIDDVSSLIEESLDGANRVKRIVMDLKGFARVDEEEYKSADIHECLEKTINIVWNELKYKVTLHKEYGEIPNTKCYPQQLNQVFMNMLVNAAHAIEKQGDITIATRLADNDIQIIISDTGCGIPEDLQSKIFDPFFTTKEVGKGTGLGLSITYDIIKKHNGSVSVSSEPGKGTTFTISLPVQT